MKRQTLTPLQRARQGPCVAHKGSDYDGEEIAFLKAVDTYRRRFRRPFPTVCEMLGILKELGYRKP